MGTETIPGVYEGLQRCSAGIFPACRVPILLPGLTGLTVTLAYTAPGAFLSGTNSAPNRANLFQWHNWARRRNWLRSGPAAEEEQRRQSGDNRVEINHDSRGLAEKTLSAEDSRAMCRRKSRLRNPGDLSSQLSSSRSRSHVRQALGGLRHALSSREALFMPEGSGGLRNADQGLNHRIGPEPLMRAN